MLHLDQNHSALSSPHSKPNLILSNTPRPDQHSVLSWSAPARDAPPFFQESQEQPAVEKPSTPPIQPDTPAAATETNPEPVASAGSVAPGNAEDPKLSDQSPSSPPDATSPTVESTSSLTPPPSTTSPAFSSVELPDGEASGQQKVEGKEEEEQTRADGNGDAGDKVSRASSPLSELSPAPEPDESSASTKKGETEEEKPSAGNGDVSSKDAKPSAGNTGISEKHGHANPGDAKELVAFGDQRAGPSSRAQSIATPEPAAITTAVANSSSKVDPKVDVMIELNAELLRVFMEFQARGIPLTDARAQQYSVRLQSNLTWMAAAADEHRKFSVHSIPLPNLQAPPPLDFISVERIQQIYHELPGLFAKDLMRRQSMSSSGAASSSASGLSNGHLKRERTEDAISETGSASKRRDTGGSKTSTPAPSTPLGNSSPIQPISATMTQPGTPTHPISAPNLAGPSNNSPSMPPPAVPAGMMSNANEAQVAAARERARQMQMRQAMQQQMMGDGGRQMSSGPSQQGGMPNMPGSSSLSQAQIAALSAQGPAAVQCYQILQNPQHPLVQYMIANVPGFQTFPLVQQIQQLQRVQLMMQARSQQQRAAGAQAGSMSGFPQAGGHGVPNGSPTRMSPGGQQTPMQQQGGFPFPGGGGGGGQGGMDPRTPGAMGLTPAQQANLANLNPQQRQLLLLQQQQMMRGGNAPNQSMMNQQMFNAAQQQQQQQRMAGSSPHIGSPMLGGPTDGGNFPAALRSNPGVPGIARSARTPSDHAPSPMTPQLSQRSSGQMDDFQRAMMQQAQRNMAQGGGMSQLGNMNAAWPQAQQNQMQANQGSFGAMSPPGSASGFGGMPGGSPSLGGSQQWSPNSTGGSFPFNAGSPSANMQGADAPGSRQASATPAPQQQLSQNDTLAGADQTGLSDFDIFDWGQ